MGDVTARKFFCEDAHKPLRNVAPLVISEFNPLGTMVLLPIVLLCLPPANTSYGAIQQSLRSRQLKMPNSY